MSSDRVRLSDLKQRIGEETRFKSQEEHCRSYVWIFGEQNDWDSEDYETLGEEGCKDYPKELFEW